MKKIYINPGHSDNDPGAVKYARERDLNVAVAKHMNEHLLANYECETRVYSNDSLTVVCNDANAWGADLFVSIHFNAGGGDGYEAWVHSEVRRPLGLIFEKHIKAAGQNSRGVKVKPSFFVLRNTNMPAVLNEGAFVDNRKDIQDWNDDAELKAMGIAYAKAAAEFLGLKEKPVINVTYSLEQFVRDVQKACGASVDGIAGKETLSKTVTISAQKNRTHAVVKPVQKRLAALGYTMVGEAAGIADTKFTAAVTEFQSDNKCWVDGEITARNKTWKKLLGMS